MCLAVSFSCAGSHECPSFFLTIGGLRNALTSQLLAGQQAGRWAKKGCRGRARTTRPIALVSNPGKYLPIDNLVRPVFARIQSCRHQGDTGRPVPHPPGPGAVQTGAQGRDRQRIYKPRSTYSPRLRLHGPPCPTLSPSTRPGPVSPGLPVKRSAGLHGHAPRLYPWHTLGFATPVAPCALLPSSQPIPFL